MEAQAETATQRSDHSAADALQIESKVLKGELSSAQARISELETSLQQLKEDRYLQAMTMYSRIL